MKRQIILSTALASTLFFSSVSALSLWTSTCNYFGITGCSSYYNLSKDASNPVQTFSFTNFFNKWELPVFNTNADSDNSPNIQLAQFGQGQTFSPSTIQTNDKNIPGSNDFGILSTKSGSDNSLLNLEKIAERKAIFECSINPGTNCSKVLNSLENKFQTNQQPYDPNKDISMQEKNQAIQNGDIVPRGTMFDPNDPNRYAPQGYSYVGTVDGDSDHGDVTINSYARRNSAPDLQNLNFRSVCGTKGGSSITPIGASGEKWFGIKEKLRNDVIFVSTSIGKAPYFTSGFRSAAMQASMCANRKPGVAMACGPNGSQHSQGWAVDLTFKGYTNEEKVKAILLFMSLGYSIINYDPDTHTHIGMDGGQTTWYTNTSTTPPPHTRKAFQLAGVSKGMTRSQVSDNANQALKAICN